MITKQGIEANPKQVHVIVKLASPKTPKEVQGLAGRLAALGRFIPRSSDKVAPFFRTLKKAMNFSWNAKCDEEFDELKHLLATPTVMTAPKAGETLYLYIAISEISVSAALISRVAPKGEEKLVYYVSRTMVAHEKQYAPIEKAALAVVTTATKLRPYFQAHFIIVLTNLPLKSTLS
ncbi:unnamed protein product [Linum trigynum]|uniref:Reverse transcriptase/retrotransposon-derived protein RNase H-like domain-containing protein n=1 Tax=Linum trigynum TaxID=586398 RepID=A0AAV2D7N4_9ROSI